MDRTRGPEDGMTKKRRSTPANSHAKMVTAERAARLYRLIRIVSQKPQTREMLRKRLRLDLRGFYRDLELLRESGIELPLVKRRYVLSEPMDQVLPQLPFPDPRLTLGDAVALAKGRTKAHRKLREIISAIES
jgi:hypothetical protein